MSEFEDKLNELLNDPGQRSGIWFGVFFCAGLGGGGGGLRFCSLGSATFSGLPEFPR